MAAPFRYIRQPIVSVLGHVDHGKTTFLDFIRGTTVAARESGAITQHIGATEVPIDTIYNVCGDLLKGKKFTLPGLLFIDTPGHHAFTTLRSRSGSLADIAVLIVDITVVSNLKPLNQLIYSNNTKHLLSLLLITSMRSLDGSHLKKSEKVVLINNPLR